MTEHNPILAIIEKHRNSCLFYIKFDIGILTAIGTIVTIFRLEKLETFRFMTKINYIVAFVIFLLIAGLIFDRGLLKLWELIKLGVIDGASGIKWFSIGTTIQVMFHVLFIFNVGIFALASITGYISGYDASGKMMSIQQEIENFAFEEKRFPKDLDELMNRFIRTKFTIEEIGSEQINYSTHKTRGYILRHAGPDGKLNTSDDKIIDHQDYVNLFEKDVSVKK